jgi:hypothetical protein
MNSIFMTKIRSAIRRLLLCVAMLTLLSIILITPVSAQEVSEGSGFARNMRNSIMRVFETFTNFFSNNNVIGTEQLELETASSDLVAPLFAIGDNELQLTLDQNTINTTFSPTDSIVITGTAFCSNCDFDPPTGRTVTISAIVVGSQTISGGITQTETFNVPAGPFSQNFTFTFPMSELWPSGLTGTDGNFSTIIADATNCSSNAFASFNWTVTATTPSIPVCWCDANNTTQQDLNFPGPSGTAITRCNAAHTFSPYLDPADRTCRFIPAGQTATQVCPCPEPPPPDVQVCWCDRANVSQQNTFSGPQSNAIAACNTANANNFSLRPGANQFCSFLPPGQSAGDVCPCPDEPPPDEISVCWCDADDVIRHGSWTGPEANAVDECTDDNAGNFSSRPPWDTNPSCRALNGQSPAERCPCDLPSEDDVPVCWCDRNNTSRSIMNFPGPRDTAVERCNEERGNDFSQRLSERYRTCRILEAGQTAQQRCPCPGTPPSTPPPSTPPPSGECPDGYPGDIVPTIITVTPNEDGCMHLTWTLPSEPYTGYLINYGPGCDYLVHYFEINEGRNVTHREICDLTPGQNYCFRIRAMNGCAMGEWSRPMTPVPVSGNTQNTIFLLAGGALPIGFAIMEWRKRYA